MTVNKTDARKLQRLQAWEPPPNAATLIAAAPDMLAALKFVSKYHAMRAEKGEPLPYQLVDAGRAAIAKAEGRQ
jgi:hypothetical protein